MLESGRVLQDRYQINHPLGMGGMGSVYEALDLRLSALVAVKENLLAGEEVRKAFEREAQLLANLHHPALPRVTDYFAQGESLFLVMDFIPGNDLKSLLDLRTKPFTWEEVCGWLPALLEALIYLHTHEPQVLHRDIKPSNLKLSPTGEVYLLDFGLARGTIGHMTAGTLSRSVFGYSPHYSSLEQIQGDRTTVQSDIYALGATLYFLLTKRLPADALSRVTARLEEEPDPLLPLEQVISDVPPGVAQAINRSLALKPSDRPRSVEEFQQAAHLPRLEDGFGAAPKQMQAPEIAAPHSPVAREGQEVETKIIQKSKLPFGRDHQSPFFLSTGKRLALAAGFVVVCLMIYAFFFRTTTKDLSLLPSPAVTPSLSASPSPNSSANPVQTIKELNLTGQWALTNRIVTTSYAPYRGLRLGYDLSLQQRGTAITGKGEKVSENGREILASARSPISLTGKLEGRQLNLSFVENGVKRVTRGSFQLTVNEEGTAWTGTFKQTAASTRGETTATKLPSPKRK